MDIKQLRYFLALTQTGNITRTAQELFITQQALSKAILKLEQELGVSLFERTTRGMRLTEYGKCLLPHAKKVTRDIDAALHAVSEMKQSQRYVIPMGYVVGSYHSLSALPPALLTEWEAQQPGAAIFIQERIPDELSHMIGEEELDLAYIVSAHEIHRPGLSCATLTSEPYALLVPEVLLPEDRQPDMRFLRETPVLVGRIGPCPADSLKVLCEGAGFTPSFRFFNGPFSQCAERVHAGEGMMIAGRSYCRSVRADGLRVCPFPDNRAKLYHMLVWRTDRDYPECVRALISWLKKHCADLQ